MPKALSNLNGRPMRRKNLFNWVVIGSVAFALWQCVPYRKFQDMQQRAESCESQLSECRRNNAELQNQIDSLKERIAALEEEVQTLKEDTAMLGSRYRKVQALNREIQRLYEDIKRQYRELMEQCSMQSEELSMQLRMKAEELRRKEQELKELERRLREMEAELLARERRVKELERLLAQKDSALVAFKKRIQDALLGFKDEDLQVTIKDGKIYVTMSEKLLFKSGSYKVEPEGERALAKLAQVLKDQKDFTIMVEGHTDNVPIHTKCIRDNWDLSVLRATSVVRLLTEKYGLDPRRLVAAGRGEYMPVAPNDTPEGRAKNRRTEIILIPNIDKILQLLQSGDSKGQE